MSHRHYRIPYRIPYRPSCWNCRRLKKSRRIVDGNPAKGAISISAPSIIDAMAGYYCDNYWFGDKPDATEMLCAGREYQSVYR